MWSAFRAKSKFLSLAFKGQSLVPTFFISTTTQALYVLTTPDISLVLNILSSTHLIPFSVLSFHLEYCSHYPFHTSVTPSFSKYTRNDQSNLRPFQNIRQVWTFPLPVSSLPESCFYVCFKNLQTPKKKKELTHSWSSVHSVVWLFLSIDAKYTWIAETEFSAQSASPQTSLKKPHNQCFFN